MALRKLNEGWELFKESCSFLFKKPIFLIPIFFSWIIFAAVVLYFRYYFQFPASIELGIFYVYLLIFVISLSICSANIMMLEFMQQMESGEKISFSKAFGEAVSIDFIRIIPIAIIWSILWLIIVVIRALTSKEKSSGKSEPSPRDAARTLGGADSGPFSWLKLGLTMIEKLIRMVVFLSLPAIAWENTGPFSALGKAFGIIKKHSVQFLTTYTLTGIVALIMAFPLVIIFTLDESGVKFPDLFWTGVITYEGIMWTLGIYLEQMSTGLLYLWHLKWVKNGSVGELSSVPKPDLLDDVYELKLIKNI